MKSTEEIEKVLKQHKSELVERYRVKEIGVFGSYIRGEQGRKSDVDILVEFEEVPDLLTFIEMERYLEGLLERKVDLVEKTSLKQRLKDIILNEVVYV